MTGREQPEATSRPGAIALSWAGVTELFLSAILYGLKIYPASITFGIGALFVALVANSIVAQGRTMQRRKGITAPPETDGGRRVRQVGFFVSLIFGMVAVAAAVIQLLSGGYLPAITFGVWTLCCAVFAWRFR